MSSAMNQRFTARYVLLHVLPVALLASTLLAAWPSAATAAPGDKEYAAAAALYNQKAYDLATEAWKAFLKAAPDHPRAAHGQYYLGISHFHQQQFAEAQAAFETLLKNHPKFDQAEAALLYLGLSEFSLARASGDARAYEKAAATFNKLIEQFPKGAYLPQARYYRAEALYSQGKKEDAVPLYQAVIADQKAGSLKADALYALGVVEEELSHPEQAATAYHQFLTEFPEHDLAVEVGFRLGESLLAREQYAEAEKYFESAAANKEFRASDLANLRVAECLAARRRYAEAADRFQQLVRDFPESAYRDKARLEGGKCAYLAGKFQAAIDALKPLAKSQGEIGAEAAHWTARSLLRAGDPAEAYRVAEAAAGQAGKSAFLGQLLLDQADALYEQPEKRQAAVEAYVALADRYADDPAAVQARYMAGFALLGQGKYEQALQQTQEFLKRYPSSDLVPDVKYVAAECELQLKDYAHAAALYRELITNYPNHAESEAWKVRLGRTLHLQGDAQGAIDVLSPAIAAIRDPDRRAEALFLLGISQSDLQKFSEAAKSLTASLAAAPSWRQADETLLALAQAQFRLGDLPAARKTVAQLIEKFPKSPALDRAWYLSAEYAYEAGDLEIAAAQYQRVLDDFPNSPLASRARYGLGWTQYSQGDFDKAVDSLTKMLAAVPERDQANDEHARRAYYVRGLARYNLAKDLPAEMRARAMTAAAEDLNTFLKLVPQAAERADALYMLGLAQAGSGAAAEAVATYRALLKEFPKYHAADKVLYELAWTLHDLGQHEEATETFAELAKQHGNSPLAAEARFAVGEAQYAAKDFASAATSYYQAERQAQQLAADKVITPEQASELGERAAHKLAWSYYHQKDFENAEKSFAYQLRAYPNGTFAGDARFMQGESLFKLGKFAEALPLLKSVENVTNPEFQALAVLHAAQAASQLEKFDEALALLKDYRKRFPDASTQQEATYEEGWALQNLGKLDDAQALYEQVIEEDGTNNSEVAAKSRFMIGEIYFEKKDHAQAIIQFYLVAKGYGYPKWQANAYYEAARCFEVLKKPEQAVTNYREVLRYQDSDKRPLAEDRIKALGG